MGAKLPSLPSLEQRYELVAFSDSSSRGLAQDTVAVRIMHLYIRGGHGDGEVCWKDGDYGKESLNYPVALSLAIPLWAESILSRE